MRHTTEAAGDPLGERFERTRVRSQRLASSLSAEDQQIQAFDYASPTKWHLAHTTWFFETFVLGSFAPELAPRRVGFDVLFNSYYEGVGERFARSRRGLLSRPALMEVMDYRLEIDAAVIELLGRCDDAELRALVELGVAHEEQHQELLLTDILANLSVNPLGPAWRDESPPPSPEGPAPRFIEVDGGVVEVGAKGEGFCFDNETPRHRHYLDDFALRSTLVTNAEVIGFVEDGGYGAASLWLSDGIAWVREHGIEAPEYWRRDADGTWSEFTLYGRRPLDLAAPATHLSAYEADAVATWLGARLPTEQEWEIAAERIGGDPTRGRWLEDGPVLPRAGSDEAEGLLGLWGETWEWTRSAYAPYPGFSVTEGAVGEYNGKFMANQWVLRGGSCATPPGHVRRTYRNFFYPDQRWQFTGLRLARRGSTTRPSSKPSTCWPS